jgi:uncharacterized protein YjdB
MVSRRTDRLLHKITHHTNLEQPYDKNISGIIYPAQDADKLGRTVTLRYKNRYIPDSNHINDSSPDRYEPGPGYIDEEGNIIKDIYEDEFIVLRCDLTAPFKALFLSVDYKIMLVGDSRTYQDVVLKYPKQIEEYIGLYLIDQYFETPFVNLNGVLLSCDSSEPGNGIIAEFYMNNTVRFLLDYEVQAVVLDRYDPDGERDYNGMDPEDHPFVYIDLNGKFPRNEGEPITIDADGGYPDPLADMYRKDILTLEEVCELRGRIITERQIYGSHGITPREVIVTPSRATIYKDETVQLEAEVKIPTPPYDEVIWKSSDESLATVDENGLVTGVGSGKVYIYAIATDVWGRSTIFAKVAVESIELNQTSMYLPIGDTFQFEATILPENATDKKLTWISSDESLATVNSKGKVTGKAEGSVMIIARSNNGVEAVCNVEVIDTYVPVESVRITNVSGGVLNLSTNGSDPDEFVLNIEVLPENATNKNVFGRVKNKYEDFAVYVENITETTIRVKGLCYDCKHPNIVEVYSLAHPEVKDTIEVYVDTKLESIALSKYDIDLDPGFDHESIRTTAELDIIFYPHNKGVIPDIITAGVNEEGVLSVMETLTNSNDNVIAIEDTESYKTIDHYSKNKLIVKADQPGTSEITVTDPISGQVHTCNVLVGESGINYIKFIDIPDWETVHPGDSIDIQLDVDPYYWHQFPDLYNINYTIEGNEGNPVEIINNITYITVIIRDYCSDVTVIATANSGVSNSFIININ